MKHAWLLLALLATSSGCTYRTLFGVFNGAYTDAGGSVGEQQHHFDQRVEAFENGAPR